MITTLYNPGRRYPQMGNTGSVFVGHLQSGGAAVPPTPVVRDYGGMRKRQMKMLRQNQEIEDIVKAIAPAAFEHFRRTVH